MQNGFEQGKCVRFLFRLGCIWSGSCILIFFLFKRWNLPSFANSFLSPFLSYLHNVTKLIKVTKYPHSPPTTHLFMQFELLSVKQLSWSKIFGDKLLSLNSLYTLKKKLFRYQLFYFTVIFLFKIRHYKIVKLNYFMGNTYLFAKNILYIVNLEIHPVV